MTSVGYHHHQLQSKKKFFFFFCHTAWHAGSWFTDQGQNPCPYSGSAKSSFIKGVPGGESSVFSPLLEAAQSSAPSLLGAREERAALCIAGRSAVSLPSTRITIRCQGHQHHHHETMTIKRCPDMTRCPSESILKIPISSHQPEHPWDTTCFCPLFPPARSFHLSE